MLGIFFEHRYLALLSGCGSAFGPAAFRPEGPFGYIIPVVQPKISIGSVPSFPVESSYAPPPPETPLPSCSEAVRGGEADLRTSFEGNLFEGDDKLLVV